jgi:hypothetical protein
MLDWMPFCRERIDFAWESVARNPQIGLSLAWTMTMDAVIVF